MDKRGSNSCYKIIEQEFLASPYPFKDASKDEQCVHVEQNMGKTAVHEHVGYKLERLEERRLEVEQ